VVKTYAMAITQIQSEQPLVNLGLRRYRQQSHRQAQNTSGYACPALRTSASGTWTAAHTATSGSAACKTCNIPTPPPRLPSVQLALFIPPVLYTHSVS